METRHSSKARYCLKSEVHIQSSLIFFNIQIYCDGFYPLLCPPEMASDSSTTSSDMSLPRRVKVQSSIEFYHPVDSTTRYPLFFMEMLKHQFRKIAIQCLSCQKQKNKRTLSLLFSSIILSNKVRSMFLPLPGLFHYVSTRLKIFQPVCGKKNGLGFSWKRIYQKNIGHSQKKIKQNTNSSD